MSGPESQWVAHQVCQVHRLGGHVWAHEPVVPLSVQTSGPGDEQHTGSNQWDTYLYGAYLTMLVGYGCQAKKTWLKHLEGWATDEAEIYNVREN